MRRLIVLALVLGVFALVAGPALTQPPRGGMGGGATGAMLLGQKAVQEELKLTEDQIAKVREFGQKQAEKMKELFGGGDREKMAEAMKAAAAEGEKMVKELLKEDQAKRLKEIQLQVRGFQAFADEEIQKTLKITDEQKDKLKAIGEELAKDRKELFAGGGFGNPETQKKMQALNKEANDKATALLTAEQKAELEKLSGKAFDTSKIQLFGGGGFRKKDKQ
jgi:Spy/CpxP family protein refolding chaperone